MQPSDSPTTAVSPPPRPSYTAGSGGQQRPRWVHLALFVICIAWFRIATVLADSAGTGFALRLNLADQQPLLSAVALLFLVVVGIGALHSMNRGLAPLRWVLGLTSRDTSLQEFGTGAALGWGVAAVTALTMFLGRSLHAQIWTTTHAFVLLIVGLLTIGIVTLAKVLAVFGYGFQNLIEAIGQARATLLVLLLVFVDEVFTRTPYGTPDGYRILVAACAALVLSLCWLRTRAVWLGWGAWFGWAVSTAFLFGLPLGSDSADAAIVVARGAGPAWLTGYAYGPSAALPMLVLLVAVIPILLQVTDEYAWRYTRKPLIPAGIPVDIPPPAAHVQAEAAAAPLAPTLVQIHPIPPPPPPADIATD